MNLEEQKDTMNAFHDGTIVEVSNVNNNLLIKIEIPYLAEIVSKEYEYFFVELLNCKEFNFQNYGDDNLISDFNEIARLEPEMLYSDKNNFQKLVIDCSVPHGAGGKLFIKAKSIKVYDQNKNVVTDDKLTEYNNKYWNSEA